MDNYIKIEAGGARIQDLLCDRQNVTELSGDFSLPDYQPEIKRLLRVRATVSPPDKYIGTGNVDFSGMIDYCILYAGNDGALYCANESQEYQFSVPLEMTSDFDLGDGLVCDAETVADMAVGRVIAPRKLSVKCRLRSRVQIRGTWRNRSAEERNQALSGCAEARNVQGSLWGRASPFPLGMRSSARATTMICA